MFHLKLRLILFRVTDLARVQILANQCCPAHNDGCGICKFGTKRYSLQNAQLKYSKK